MQNSPISFFTVEQTQDQLTIALSEMRRSPGKRVYQTNQGIRALTDIEAETDRTAQRIDFGNHEKALSLIMKQCHQRQPSPIIAQLVQEHVGQLSPQKTRILDSKRLRETAEIQGFGYKKANLDQVDELCREDFGPYKLRVPAYAGISSDTIQRLLKRKCGLDVSAKWQAIVDKHFPPNSPDLQTAALKSKQFPEGFLRDSAQLQREIAKAFALLIPRVEDEGGLDALLDVKNLAPVIKKVQNANERLMVRSTGKEDTVELANAGGNTSVSNVIPSNEEILNAICSVVISYFGEKSLKQRLGASDRSLFEPSPLTPVLVQRMIGEKSPAAMPLCGVMFTEDPESRLAAAANTNGNTIVQAAYGHNEAVVNSLIPVDSYYINDEGALFPIVRPKTHRMVPTDKSGDLRLVENSPDKALAAALPKPALDSLKAFARRIEQFYGRPMDIEFVIDGNTIYIVQARPIVHKESAPPSYISDVKKLGDVKVLKGSAIGAAGGGIRLAQAREIITATTISEALEKYQKHSDPESIQAIIAEKMAPSTSHWATIFRNEGKPVLYIPSADALLEDSEAHFLLSPQQGMIVNLGTEAITLEDLLEDGTCALGQVEYPAAPLLSTCPQFQSNEPLTDEAICDIYPALRDPKKPALRDPKKWDYFRKNAGDVKFRELFDALRTAQGEALQIGLATLLFAFRHTLEKRSQSLPPDLDRQLRTQALQSQALAMAKSIKRNGEFLPADAQYGRKLLAIHFLKALVYAQPAADEVVAGDSLALDLREIQEEQLLTQELQKQGITLTNPYSLSLLRLGRFAVTPEIAKQYRDYIISLDRAQSEDLLQNMAQLIHKLHNLDALIPWLNITFPGEPDVAVHIEAFARQMSLFQSLAEKRGMLRALNIAAFGNKKSFHTQWQVLTQQLLPYVKSHELSEHYKTADTVGKLAIQALMSQVVETFDLSIKALEGSGEFTLEEKLPKFQSMLQEYYSLASAWLTGFPFPSDTVEKMTQCLDKIQRVVNKTDIDHQDLAFSEEFDVRAFGSSSGAIDEVVVAPETLEDAFSGTHRELLTMINLLFQGVSKTPIPLPPYLRAVTSKLQLGNAAGIELTTQGIIAHYTKPLRQHGVQYSVHQPFGSEKLSLTVRYSAENENYRWDRFAQFMFLARIYEKLDVTDIEVGQRGVAYTIQLDKSDNLAAIDKMLTRMEHYSINAMFDEDLDAHTIENRKQGLVPLTDRKIVKELERLFGIEAIASIDLLRSQVQALIKIRPSLGMAFLHRAWQLDLDPDTREFTDGDLPIRLINTGGDIPVIAARAAHLVQNGGKELGFGMRLLYALAQKDPKALPAGCVWGILTQIADTWNNDQEDMEGLLAHLEAQRPPESIHEQLVTALRSSDTKDKIMASDVLKLVFNKNNKYARYKTTDLVTALRCAAVDPTIQESTQQQLRKYLGGFPLKRDRYRPE